MPGNHLTLQGSNSGTSSYCDDGVAVCGNEGGLPGSADAPLTPSVDSHHADI